MRPILLASLLALPLAACGGSPEPGGDVVGSWRAVPYDDTPVDQRQVLTFSDDGSYATDDGTSTSSGTWTASDGALTLEDGAAGGGTSKTLYYADDHELLFGLLQPDDDGADPVATWTGWFENDFVRTDTTATLKDDGTVHFEQVTGTDPASLYDGTWAQTGDDVVLTFEVDDGQGGTFTLHLHASLYEGFLGSPYEKI